MAFAAETLVFSSPDSSVRHSPNSGPLYERIKSSIAAGNVDNIELDIGNRKIFFKNTDLPKPATKDGFATYECRLPALAE